LLTLHIQALKTLFFLKGETVYGDFKPHEVMREISQDPTGILKITSWNSLKNIHKQKRNVILVFLRWSDSKQGRSWFVEHLTSGV